MYSKSVIWSDFISNSHHISRIGFDLRSKILYIKFHNNTTYAYYSVPTDLVMGIIQADSHGKYFWRYIRNNYHGEIV